MFVFEADCRLARMQTHAIPARTEYLKPSSTPRVCQTHAHTQTHAAAVARMPSLNAFDGVRIRIHRISSHPRILAACRRVMVLG